MTKPTKTLDLATIPEMSDEEWASFAQTRLLEAMYSHDDQFHLDLLVREQVDYLNEVFALPAKAMPAPVTTPVPSKSRSQTRRPLQLALPGVPGVSGADRGAQ